MIWQILKKSSDFELFQFLFLQHFLCETLPKALSWLLKSASIKVKKMFKFSVVLVLIRTCKDMPHHTLSFHSLKALKTFYAWSEELTIIITFMFY